MKPYGVAIQMKAFEPHFPVTLFVFHYFTEIRRNLDYGFQC